MTVSFSKLDLAGDVMVYLLMEVYLSKLDLTGDGLVLLTAPLPEI